MIRQLYPLLLCLLFFRVPIFAQDIKTDSLVRLLETAAADTGKVNLLNDISRKLYGTSPQEALGYSKTAIQLAQKLGYKRGLALAYKNAGMSHYVRGEFAETINYWQLSKEAFISNGDKAGVANIVSNMGAVYDKYGEDNKAIELYFEAQKAADEIGDSLRLVTTMVNIATIYLKKPETVGKSIEIYLQALPIAKKIRYQDGIENCTVNLGEAYFKKGDIPSALLYYKEAMKGQESTTSSSLSYTLTSIGNVYAKQGDYQAALVSQGKALDMAEKLNAKQEMVTALLGLAGTYDQQGDAKKSIESLDRAQLIAREIHANFELRDAYTGLARIHAAQSDFQNAYKYQSLLTDIKDTLYLSSNDNLIKQQQLGFDLVKKEGEVELQKLAVKQQRIVKNAFLAGLILILIIAFIIFRNFLDKVKVNRLLDKQKDQIENLLLNILPQEVARELQNEGAATPRDYQSVSVLFTDFKGFSTIAEGMLPNDLVTELNVYFQEFDNIIEKHNLEKIKTIGDAYMCAGGIPTENATHPEDVVRAGLEMQEFMKRRNLERCAAGLQPWGLRVGIHTGPVVAGVVGRKKYAYDIWGNTVNIASRMESNGEVGKVNISAATFERVSNLFSCEYRGKISAKNIGEIDMYFIDNKISTNLN